MDGIYSAAIKAGIVSCVILAVLIVLNALLGVLGSWTTSWLTLGGICCRIVELVVMVGAGALAAKFAAAGLEDLNDAVVVGAIAGAVAGLIAGAVDVIIQIVSPFLMGTAYNSGSDLGTALGIAGLSSVIGAGLGTCCCLPLWIVVCAVAGLIGAAIYFLATKK